MSTNLIVPDISEIKEALEEEENADESQLYSQHNNREKTQNFEVGIFANSQVITKYEED